MSSTRSPLIKRQTLQDKPWCSRCSSPKGLEVHHVIALADGGEDTRENCDTLCSNCHREWHRLAEGSMDYATFLDTIPSWVMFRSQFLFADGSLSWEQFRQNWTLYGFAKAVDNMGCELVVTEDGAMRIE